MGFAGGLRQAVGGRPTSSDARREASLGGVVPGTDGLAVRGAFGIVARTPSGVGDPLRTTNRAPDGGAFDRPDDAPAGPTDLATSYASLAQRSPAPGTVDTDLGASASAGSSVGHGPSAVPESGARSTAIPAWRPLSPTATRRRRQSRQPP